ncbi:MAG TPA: VanZ family protein [Nitrospira sp.]
MLASVWRIMLGVWLTSVLIVISLPWSKFDARPHWRNVQWIPFEHFSLHPTILTETVLNILAFIPVGYLAARSLAQSHQRPVLGALALGACSSVSIELYQLFCQDRVPSTSDVLMNVGGTAIGVWLAFAIDWTLTFFMLRIRRLST